MPTCRGALNKQHHHMTVCQTMQLFQSINMVLLGACMDCFEHSCNRANKSEDPELFRHTLQHVHDYFKVQRCCCSSWIDIFFVNSFMDISNWFLFPHSNHCICNPQLPIKSFQIQPSSQEQRVGTVAAIVSCRVFYTRQRHSHGMEHR